MTASQKSSAYQEAGVDIDLAQTLLARVKNKIKETKRPEVLAPIGGFGGLFQLDLSRYKEPVLVSSIDGVGTKLLIAAMLEKYDTVGYDIVNHCINDIAVQGAEPLYFLDYLGIGKLRTPLYEQVLSGMADACAAQNVTLLGGETAEMPGMYGDDFDLVGCVTGVVEKKKLITGERIKPGQLVLGLGSNGLHTNGYSLARQILFDKCGYSVDDPVPGSNLTIGEALLMPHTCYWPAIRQSMQDDLPIMGMAHITGGGLFDNVPRILPEGTSVVCDEAILPIPPIFRLIEESGEVDAVEMYRVFNMGIGMIWIVPREEVDPILAHCNAVGVEIAVIGEVVKGNQTVQIRGWED